MTTRARSYALVLVGAAALGLSAPPATPARAQQEETPPGARSGAGVTEQDLAQYVETRRLIEERMGFGRFVRLHNRIAGDPDLRARVESQLEGGRGAAGEPPYRAGPPAREPAPGGQPGGERPGVGEPAPGDGAPLPSGGALGPGPAGTGETPPGTREPALGDEPSRPIQ